MLTVPTSAPCVRIVVIEPDPLQHAMLEAALDFGCAVTDMRLFCTLAPALRHLAGLRRHVVDLELPVAMVILGSGLAAGRRVAVASLRQDPRLRDVPLVILALKEKGGGCGAVEAGADASLWKAAGFTGLVRAIEEAEAFYARVLAFSADRGNGRRAVFASRPGG